jgi:hypothetical protein
MLKTPGGDREMVEILALVLQHDEQAVLAAVELALEAGAPTKTHILNLLHRLVDGKPMDTPPIKAPIRQIAENAGVEGSIVVGKITENKSQTYGFDAQTAICRHAERRHRRSGEGCACRTADAASIAGLMITTEAMVAETPKKKEAPALPGGRMGGMDY